MGYSLGFIGILLVNIIDCSVYSVVAPYVPPIAEQKGVSSACMGLILCCNPAAALLTSIFLSKYMSYIGKKRILLVGCIMASISTIAYSLLPDTSYTSFLLLAFSMRFMQGVACGFIGTPILSIVATNYKENLQEALGFIQISIGLGYMLGPLGASLLFSIGGFRTIFIAYGAIFLLFVPFFQYILEDDVSQEMKSETIAIIKILKDRELVLYFLTQLASSGSVFYVFPTLSMHAQKLGVPESLFGAIFAIPTVTYIGSTFLVVHSCLRKKTTIICGILLLIVSNLLLGPWEYTFLPSNFIVCTVGLVILGLGLCSSNLLAVTLELEIAQEKYHRNYDSQSISDVISAISNSISYISEMVAPPLSGLMEDNFGFENAQAGLAGVLTILLIALIVDRITNSKRDKQAIENSEILESLRNP